MHRQIKLVNHILTDIGNQTSAKLILIADEKPTRFHERVTYITLLINKFTHLKFWSQQTLPVPNPIHKTLTYSQRIFGINFEKFITNGSLFTF